MAADHLDLSLTAVAADEPGVMLRARDLSSLAA
jgi:hypothetical protein